MKIVTTAVAVLMCFFAAAQAPIFPVIKGYGGIYPVPEMEWEADTSKIYYLLADVTGGATQPDQVAQGMEKVARLLNLHAQAGVPLRNIRLVVVVHGSATDAVLGANSYLRTFGYDNPHLRLFDQLAMHQVELFVCGQAWAKRGYRPDQLVPQVKLALSALTTLTHYSQKGYTILDF